MRGQLVGIVALVMACGAGGSKQPSDPPVPDAPAATCGDGVCAASEIGACAADCGGPPMTACGNGTCEAGETSASCPGDCPASGVCGDGTCTAPTETMANCPGDCTTTSTAVCGNLVCESGEDAASCPSDCGTSTSTCPGDDIDCFFCWFDPTTCIPPQTELICEQCLGLGP